MEKKKNSDLEPQWIKDAARSMLQGQNESYGDEDQNETMNLIDNNENDQL